MAKVAEQLSIDEIRERLAPVFKDRGLRLVLLFGSVASGKSHSGSDIDLAFLFDGYRDILELTNTVIRLLHADNIDVVDLRRASPLLKFSVVKNCRLLYERKAGDFADFFSLSFRMYVDTKKLRKLRAGQIALFLKSRGMS